MNMNTAKTVSHNAPVFKKSLAACIAALCMTAAPGVFAAAPQDHTTPSVAPTDATTKEKLTDNSFVEKAAQSNLRTLELSKLALEKSQNKKLKNFAQSAVKNSSDSMTKLKEVASNFRLDVPQKLDANHQQMVSELQQLSGQKFDEAYADLMKKSQDATVGLFDNAAGQPTLNAELRVFANTQLPMLRKDQKRVHALSAPAPAAAEKSSRKTGSVAQNG